MGKVHFPGDGPQNRCLEEEDGEHGKWLRDGVMESDYSVGGVFFYQLNCSHLWVPQTRFSTCFVFTHERKGPAPFSCPYSA